jgi:hypothetical protein
MRANRRFILDRNKFNDDSKIYNRQMSIGTQTIEKRDLVFWVVESGNRVEEINPESLSAKDLCIPLTIPQYSISTHLIAAGITITFDRSRHKAGVKKFDQCPRRSLGFSTITTRS